MKKYLGSCAVAAILLATAGVATARDQIKIVGSSTVFPYTQAVAEEFANKTGKPAPVVESTGTGGGFKAFCGGVGEGFADITGASRAIKDSEVKLCKDNGVTDISEALIGYDGLSIAVSRANTAEWNFTKAQIVQALAAELPDGKGGLKANPNKKWSDIDKSLPDVNIVAFGPPPTSGTRDAFVELVMHEGCAKVPGMADIKKADEKKYTEACSRMRQDGPFIEAGENDNLIVQRLESDKNAVGIFGYSFLYENEDKLKDIKVEGVEASFETIKNGSYPVSRPLFIYIKNAHRDVIPGLKDFLQEYTSKSAMGEDGYLAERGLTPLDEAKRADIEKAVMSGKKIGS
ncbi:PstS family phosphate ABC transporter substrate-binding protein [Agrobacterium sp. P15N1-A]|uniref:PstS family phosphate ABC transporter substrate-binding protein n=1 Tax=Agrobacterium sp. P15N1-A TaxID=3342820 RepID=UPI0037CCD065